MREKPKFKFILRTDYIFFSLFILFFLSIAIEIYAYFFEPMLELEMVFGILIILSLITMILRLRHIHKAFAEWISATAIVTRVWFYRGRGNISYTFLFEGVEYRSSGAYMSNRLTRRIRKGSEIHIIVNPMKPKSTLIDELFQ